MAVNRLFIESFYQQTCFGKEWGQVRAGALAPLLDGRTIAPYTANVAF